MPYIPQDDRAKLAPFAEATPIDAGELNFQLSQTINRYLSAKPLKYQRINDVVGALDCLKFEVQRRMLTPYENHKILENGDVFTCRSKLPKGFI